MEISEEYKIIAELGTQRRRKFGKTHLIENKVTTEKAILKTINKKIVQEHISQRLIEEAAFSFELEGLPKVLSLENTENEVLLVLQCKRGVTIDEYWKTIRRKKRLPFLVDFLSKLEVIFRQLEVENIVHCDIKPSNILIEEKSNDFDVHLIDFGLAVRENDAANRKLLFPLGYAAPELLLNHLDIIDARTDICSLGILIWRLYAEKLPLVHPNPSIFTNLQLTHPLPEHSKISKSLFKILQKMTVKHSFKLPPNKLKKEDVKVYLEKAMQERYQSLELAIEDLKKVKPSYCQMISLR
ncbi:MAG: protein kinase [Fluviicola sp.]|nr:protein kinase [Fluviicola sp.]